MIEKDSSLPLVSYVLVSYNQERFIADALHSALAQDYGHLEIIVSDDCSTDGTFSIIKDIAEVYNGPHTLVVGQTPRNLGLIGNLQNAYAKFRGELVVIAAGDDVSLPARVSKIFNRWKATDAHVLYSNYALIDENGRGINRIFTQKGNFNSGPIFRRRKIHFFAGATGAYSAHILRALKLPEKYSGPEDTALLYFALVNGLLIEKIDEILVQYRSHDANMAGSSKKDTKESEHYSMKSARMLRALLEYTKQYIDQHPSRQEIVNRTVDMTVLEKELRHYSFREKWITARPRDRFRALLDARSHENVRWLLPRVFGLEPFTKLKRFLRG